MGNTNFWDSVTGTIVKITALIAAITGLIVAVGPYLKGGNDNKTLSQGKPPIDSVAIANQIRQRTIDSLRNVQSSTLMIHTTKEIRQPGREAAPHRKPAVQEKTISQSEVARKFGELFPQELRVILHQDFESGTGKGTLKPLENDLYEFVGRMDIKIDVSGHDGISYALSGPFDFIFKPKFTDKGTYEISLVSSTDHLSIKYNIPYTANSINAALYFYWKTASKQEFDIIITHETDPMLEVNNTNKKSIYLVFN